MRQNIGNFYYLDFLLVLQEQPFLLALPIHLNGLTMTDKDLRWVFLVPATLAPHLLNS